MKDYKFGLIFGKEKEVIFKSLKELTKNFKEINIIEVGFNEGITGTAMQKISKDLGLKSNYFGIDIKEHKKMLKEEGMELIISDANSITTLNELPNKFHLVFIDSCHCSYCVKRQFKLYSQRLVKNGIILFHDTAKEFQGVKLTEPHDYSKERFCEVRKALVGLDLNNNGYEEIFRVEEDNGIVAYKK